MLRMLSHATIGLSLLLAFIQPAAAQTATPAPDDATEAFRFLDAEGVEQATISVSEVVDPYQEFVAGSEPAPGARYVALTVVFENTGVDAFEARPDHFVLQDASGYMWTQTTIQRDAEATIVVPNLQSLQIAPGDRVSGLIGFEIPEAAALDRLYYQPESTRLLTIEDLGAQPEAGPSVGAETTVEASEAGTQGVFSVVELEDPFTGYPEGYEPEDGTRYVLVTITAENTGSAPLPVSPSDIVLRDSMGFLWGYTSVQRGEDIVVPDLQSQDLAPGSRVSGVVGFQLAENVAPADVFYEPESGRIIVLAELTSSDGATPPATPGAAAGTDCEGVDAWYAETSGRITLAAELSQQAAQIEDEASINDAAARFLELANAQNAMSVPPASAELNAMLVDIFMSYHDALTTIATAGDGGGDVQADLIEGTNAFNAAGPALTDLEAQISALATGCGTRQ